MSSFLPRKGRAKYWSDVVIARRVVVAPYDSPKRLRSFLTSPQPAVQTTPQHRLSLSSQCKDYSSYANSSLCVSPPNGLVVYYRLRDDGLKAATDTSSDMSGVKDPAWSNTVPRTSIDLTWILNSIKDHRGDHLR